MIIKETYFFNRKNFVKGIDIKTGESFLDLLDKWEKDFYYKHSNIAPNEIRMNYANMLFIKKCFGNNYNNLFFGIEKDTDLEESFKMDEYSNNKTVYALSSEITDEPILLIIDNTVVDNKVIFKYISDNDDNTVEKPVPVNVDLLKK